MGGMAAQIPVPGNKEENDKAFKKVEQDKIREAKAGHDGTWVAHPALVGVAKKVFDELMPTPNQIHIARSEVSVSEKDLIAVPKGTISEAGLRMNLNVGIQYIEAWLRGSGAVPLNYLMEDAATAEISRTQVWSWIKHGAKLDDGKVITRTLVIELIEDELASGLFTEMATAASCPDFLTLPAYEFLLSPIAQARTP
eukprot:TRINITY_DN891_c0_g1_i1.p1 TRINITY_DN891_c0_g1~~TRINITY_DN891_c0_g1_i1.p1  ORF type:complete len:224 (-),score=38.33 TRINITY_DN891_c0_g1_i1:32-622(-)